MYSFLFLPKQDVEDIIRGLCQTFFGIDKELLDPAVTGSFFAVNFDNRFNPSAIVKMCGELLSVRDAVPLVSQETPVSGICFRRGTVFHLLCG